MASVAAATEIRVEAAVVAVLSKLDGISELKKEQRMAFKCFLNGKEVFPLLSADFGKSFVSHPSKLWLSKGQLYTSNIAACTNRKTFSVAYCLYWQ